MIWKKWLFFFLTLTALLSPLSSKLPCPVEDKTSSRISKGEARTNGENRINICTLPRVTQVTGGKLLIAHGAQSGPLWWPDPLGTGWAEGREAGERGDICILTADSHCCAAEAKKTLQSNFLPTKKKIKGCQQNNFRSSTLGNRTAFCQNPRAPPPWGEEEALGVTVIV